MEQYSKKKVVLRDVIGKSESKSSSMFFIVIIWSSGLRIKACWSERKWFLYLPLIPARFSLGSFV
ncbi:unnamed protein product [Pneumocystis jirovecii]|uniref:Uncharacterized protein n=1 Tax=Pneumocystis jirovecii TaxID=42068 RepID=L0PCZ3_PNEJI|nr:unnamed protein product [Pneumocystis jirovecii]